MNIHRNKDIILATIKKEGVVTTSEISHILKVSWNTAEKYLLELALDKKVQRVKKTGVNLWVKT
jgi:Mn-dependent DtxR family transcriptional regulator